MLRSFDYAARVVERSLSTSDDADAARIDHRAQEWSERNKNHFLHAYVGGQPTHAQQVLLNAYVADKAVYETVYETRNRPSWVAIPLQAVARIGAA
jgi:maltokinase